MYEFLKKNLIENKINLIILIGLLVRVLFYFFGASIYYGSETFVKGGDSKWWLDNFVNFINHFTYTDELNTEYGYFTRLPGYSFFIGFFYLLSGKKMFLAFKMVAFAQIILDSISIYFVFKISEYTFKSKRTSIITSVIYALYPFIIVWNVIVYAETLSIFFLLFSILLILKKPSLKGYIVSSFLLGLGILTRIQLILIIPVIIGALIYSNKKLYGDYINKKIIWFTLVLGLTYGSWPLRNYINHNKIIFYQHLGDKKHWAPDYMYYMYYIWAVKTDHEPQFSQIMKNLPVEFPKESYKVEGDSLKLIRVVELMRECGEGVSYFRESEKIATGHVEKGKHCNAEIVKLFKELIQNQKEKNALNYYFFVPINNLKKAIFKFNLTEKQKGKADSLLKLLFLYRTLLIFLGIFGLFKIFRLKDNDQIFLTFLVSGYAVFWYLFQSFFYRNMEIRFLLHADVLLLFPAAFYISFLFEKIKPYKIN
jgi:4-amino-4-deoxy-L-arabinose transferase-like glycosyltransferase